MQKLEIKNITPKQEKIIVATAIGTSVAVATGFLLWSMRKIEPVKNGKVTSPYGNRIHPITGGAQFHNGIDISAESGTKIRSIMSGVCTGSGYDNINGYWVKVKHLGVTSFYGHMLKPAKVKQGDVIRKGQVIGYVGSTGMSTGPHVHFMIFDNKTWNHTDPLKTNLFKVKK